MDNLQLASALNEWMRRFIDEPNRFEQEFVSVNRFLKEIADGAEPSYGEVGAKYLNDISMGMQKPDRETASP